MNILNEIIRDLMFENKKTITDVSNMTGFDIDRIKSIVLNDAIPTMHEAYVILGRLGVDLGEMLR